jgi:hypothetical protein
MGTCCWVPAASCNSRATWPGIPHGHAADVSVAALTRHQAQVKPAGCLFDLLAVHFLHAACAMA